MAMAPQTGLPGPKLICPECGMAGRLNSRVGNRRGKGCWTCNRWASRVRREAGRVLAERHPEEYRALQRTIGVVQYVEFARSWLDRHPPIEELLAAESESWAPLTEAR